MNTVPETVSFRCRPSSAGLVLGLLAFAAMAVFFVWLAETDKRGLVLNGLIHLSPGAAAVFYQVLAGVIALFVLVGASALFTVLVFGVPDVVVGPDSVSFPVGFPVKRPFVLPLAEIEGLSRSEVHGQRFLMLHTSRKKHWIPLNWLASDAAREQFENELTHRLAAVRASA